MIKFDLGSINSNSNGLTLALFDENNVKVFLSGQLDAIGNYTVIGFSGFSNDFLLSSGFLVIKVWCPYGKIMMPVYLSENWLYYPPVGLLPDFGISDYKVNGLALGVWCKMLWSDAVDLIRGGHFRSMVGWHIKPTSQGVKVEVIYND